jgi:hypothetical protein
VSSRGEHSSADLDPAYFYYGLGDEVELSTEIMAVRLR